MKKLNFSTAMKNIGKNLGLLMSAIPALCLFVCPLVISYALIVVYAAVAAVCAFDAAKPAEAPVGRKKTAALVLALFFALVGYDIFNSVWITSGRAEEIAQTSGVPVQLLLTAAGVVCCIAGFYAMYILSCRIVEWAGKAIKELLPVQQEAEIKANIKRNWYFPLSAVAFFCLNLRLFNVTTGCMVGILIAAAIALLVSSQIPSILGGTKSKNIVLRVLSILTAGGVCLGNRDCFFQIWSSSSIFWTGDGLAQSTSVVLWASSFIAAIAAMPFIYFLAVTFYSRFVDIFKKNDTFGGVRAAEWVVYAVLITASVVFMALVFSRTNAFYNPEPDMEVIYTSDSGNLVKHNAFLVLMHPENDIRQPLFAMFSAPFVGIPYLVSRVISASPCVKAVLMNSVQIVMLFAANFMIAATMKLDPLKRVCFMVLSFCTYTQLLFTLMMEQYIIAYFWLAFCMYLISQKQYSERLALWGAGGTLVTSMMFMAFMSEKSPTKDLRGWFRDMVKYGVEFLALVLAFARLDVFYYLVPKITLLSKFTGKTVIFADKIYQYTAFIRNCFAAPCAGADALSYDHISWQLAPMSGVCIAGVVILLLAVVGAVLNREKPISRFAAVWIGMSVIMLIGLGWGTSENGLILYSLYFGWAFLVLLFGLVEKAEDKLNVRFLVPLGTVCASSALLLTNVPALMKLLEFAYANYPA